MKEGAAAAAREAREKGNAALRGAKTQRRRRPENGIARRKTGRNAEGWRETRLLESIFRRLGAKKARSSGNFPGIGEFIYNK